VHDVGVERVARHWPGGQARYIETCAACVHAHLLVHYNKAAVIIMCAFAKLALYELVKGGIVALPAIGEILQLKLLIINLPTL
jgi:hypothetical protein